MKVARTLEDFLTLGQHRLNCQLLHMHVLLEAHMPAPCFNNSNQLCPHSKSAEAGQHNNSESNAAKGATNNYGDNAVFPVAVCAFGVLLEY